MRARSLSGLVRSVDGRAEDLTAEHELSVSRSSENNLLAQEDQHPTETAQGQVSVKSYPQPRILSNTSALVTVHRYRKGAYGGAVAVGCCSAIKHSTKGLRCLATQVWNGLARDGRVLVPSALSECGADCCSPDSRDTVR